MHLTTKQAKALGIDLPKKLRGTAETGQRKITAVSEAVFDAMCKAHQLPVPVHEYQFAPPRRWRFDYLWEGWLALEVEGGVFTQGRHTRGAGFRRDLEKYNRAAMLGFTVIRCLPEDVESGAAFALVKQALGTKGEQP